MEYHNLEKLIKIEIFDFEPSERYSYNKKHWYSLFPEGIYCVMSGDLVEKPKKLLVKDGIVFYKPRVVLCYCSDISKTYYFENVEEAHVFVEKIKKIQGNWIE